MHNSDNPFANELASKMHFEVSIGEVEALDSIKYDSIRTIRQHCAESLYYGGEAIDFAVQNIDFNLIGVLFKDLVANNSEEEALEDL